MNNIQKAVASVTGLNELIDEQSERLSALESAHESDTTTIALMERKLDDLQYIDLTGSPFFDDEIIADNRRKQTRQRLRLMRHENPIAKQAVKLVIRFTLGKGIDFVVKDEESQKIVEEIWLDPTNRAVLFE